MNEAQKRLIESYRRIDPELLELGTYRGRPVIYTYLTSFYQEGNRHVVVVQKNGDPGDMPLNWEGLHLSPDRPDASRIIREYLDRMSKR